MRMRWGRGRVRDIHALGQGEIAGDNGRARNEALGGKMCNFRWPGAWSFAGPLLIGRAQSWVPEVGRRWKWGQTNPEEGRQRGKGGGPKKVRENGSLGEPPVEVCV
jgi:hypothetical protein